MRIVSPCCGVLSSGDDGHPIYCNFCGHRADVPRAECDCRSCHHLRGELIHQLEQLRAEERADDQAGAEQLPEIPEPFAVDEYPPDGPEGIQVSGRLWDAPRVRVGVCGDTFVLYLADESDPEKWLQIRIHESIVASWDRFSNTREDIS